MVTFWAINGKTDKSINKKNVENLLFICTIFYVKLIENQILISLVRFEFPDFP